MTKPLSLAAYFVSRFTPAENARLRGCTTQAQLTRTYRQILARSPAKFAELVKNKRAIEADLAAAVKIRQREAA